jgi:Flp pilus assembly protein TadG
MLTRLQHFPPPGIATKPRRRRGTAAVEFAVIAPVLIIFLLGMFEITRAIQVKNYLTDAARSSVRVAIQPGNSNSAVTTSVNTALSANGITPANATITILVNGSAVDVNTAKKYDQISVKVSVPISKVSWVPLYYFTSSEVDSETMIMMHL